MYTFRITEKTVCRNRKKDRTVLLKQELKSELDRAHRVAVDFLSERVSEEIG